MRDHFSYLTDEPSNAFFQKLANAESGVKPRAVAPMAKTATATATAFEKIAARLDRDIEIIRSVGSRGLNAGMQKRADVYIDQILNQADLSAEEFGEVFDKVAAAAIQGDLEAAYEELTEDVPEEFHYVVEATLAKIGHDITSLALLEKEAFAGLLRAGSRLAGRLFARGGGEGALAAGKAMAKGMGRRGAIAAGEGLAGGRALAAEARLGRQGALARAPKALGAGHSEAKAVKALGAGRAEVKALKALGPGHAEAKAVNGMLPPKPPKPPAGLAPPKSAPQPKQPKTAPGHSEAKVVKAEGERAKPPGPGRPANATSAPTPAPAEAGQAKIVKAEGERAKATADAADATKPAAEAKERPAAHLDLNEGETASSLKQQPGESRKDFSARSKRVREHVDAGRLKNDTEGGLGKALDRGGGAGGAGGSGSGSGAGGGGAGGGGVGGGPKPPANPSGEVKAMDSFKKWTNEGWGALSPQEKGALIRAGAMGAAGYRMVTGKGAVTGGEGLI